MSGSEILSLDSADSFSKTGDCVHPAVLFVTAQHSFVNRRPRLAANSITSPAEKQEFPQGTEQNRPASAFANATVSSSDQVWTRPNISPAEKVAPAPQVFTTFTS